MSVWGLEHLGLHYSVPIEDRLTVHKGLIPLHAQFHLGELFNAFGKTTWRIIKKKQKKKISKN